MTEKDLAQNLFKKTGKIVAVTPTMAYAQCLKGERPTISFDPSDPESVARAREEAYKQPVNARICGENCGLPCTMRRLENSTDNYLMGMFDVGNIE